MFFDVLWWRFVFWKIGFLKITCVLLGVPTLCEAHFAQACAKWVSNFAPFWRFASTYALYLVYLRFCVACGICFVTRYLSLARSKAKAQWPWPGLAAMVSLRAKGTGGEAPDDVDGLGYQSIRHTKRITTGWWWLVAIFYIFPYIGNNHPNWLSYVSEGLKPPTRQSIKWPRDAKSQRPREKEF